MSDARTKVLQAPQVRSVDGVKATLNIGDRVPTASGSFQPGIGGVGINPLVNTQFQYIDTGVNVEMLPRVHDNGDVTIHVDLNINSVSSYVNLGGISQPVISQKKISHDIRMREGEVGLLGGLINETRTKTVTGIPGLSNIPILKRLFTGDSIENDRSELMIVLIPHVIRRPDITPENLRAIAVGNFATVKVNYAPKPAEPVAAAPPATAPPTTAPLATAPPATAPPATAPPATAPPATAPPATAPPATAPPALAPPATAPPAAPAPPGPGGAPVPAGSMRVYFEPSAAIANASERVTVSLLIEGGADVASAPMQIQFDPKFLRLNDVILGDFFSKDGRQPVFTKNILNDTGVAIIQLNHPPGSRGAGGSGTLVSLNFQAVARGTTVVMIPHLAVRNAKGAVISNSTPQLTVTVK
jgi:general secretion pathway protein D